LAEKRLALDQRRRKIQSETEEIAKRISE